MKLKNPIQPVKKDKNGIPRFKKNEIVCYLLDKGPFDLHQLAFEKFSKDDRQQFAQMIGYSVSGFSGLSYVTDECWNRVQESINQNGDEE